MPAASTEDPTMGKSLRQFQCRDDVWTRVEALAERRGMSTDDVVQAALVQLFSRKKPTTEAPAQAGGAPKPKPPQPRPSSRPRPSGGGGLPPPGGRQAPRRPAPAPAPAAPAGARPLYLYYDGQVYEVDQDQFVIGRGSKYSDLPIKDANISRRHCAVVRRNGQYYIKDLESTNGVEFNGQRVDNHLIQEGTSYRLCDHEIRFSFIPPS
ncbi:MAG: FHA domain-containing protein [Myxococcota bacterium]